MSIACGLLLTLAILTLLVEQRRGFARSYEKNDAYQLGLARQDTLLSLALTPRLRLDSRS
jgi:hypothetical protein